jgi:hypothetical protein
VYKDADLPALEKTPLKATLCSKELYAVDRHRPYTVERHRADAVERHRADAVERHRADAVERHRPYAVDRLVVLKLIDARCVLTMTSATPDVLSTLFSNRALRAPAFSLRVDTHRVAALRPHAPQGASDFPTGHSRASRGATQPSVRHAPIFPDASRFIHAPLSFDRYRTLMCPLDFGYNPQTRCPKTDSDLLVFLEI